MCIYFLSSRNGDVFEGIVEWCRQGFEQGYSRNFLKRITGNFIKGSSYGNELNSLFR